MATRREILKGIPAAVAALAFWRPRGKARSDVLDSELLPELAAMLQRVQKHCQALSYKDRHICAPDTLSLFAGEYQSDRRKAVGVYLHVSLMCRDCHALTEHARVIRLETLRDHLSGTVEDFTEEVYRACLDDMWNGDGRVHHSWCDRRHN